MLHRIVDEANYSVAMKLVLIASLIDSLFDVVRSLATSSTYQVWCELPREHTFILFNNWRPCLRQIAALDIDC